MSSKIQPNISFSNVLWHPLKGLDSSQTKKLVVITIACGILFPVIGGIFAFFITSKIFQDRNIKHLQSKENPVHAIAQPILLPGKPISVTEHCKDLLDCFGMRSNEQNQFDSEQLKDLIKKIYDNTPREISATPDIPDLENLEPFLQRVNDYNLTLFFPTQSSPIQKEILQETISLDIKKEKRITCIPQEVFTCTNLKALRITSETLIGISSHIKELTNLQDLSIASSRFLSKIPQEIGSLQNLTTLDLTELPQLHKIPNEICSLQKLHTISLMYSGIQSLPEKINELPHLQKFNCLECKQLNIPKKLKNELEKKLEKWFQTGPLYSH